MSGKLSGRLGVASIVGEQVQRFLAEDAGTTGLEHDDGRVRLELRGERIEHAQQISSGAVEHAEVIERTTAAEMTARHLHG